MVWAVPVSIASTQGITFVFFSSGYLDVSVHRVCLHKWIILLHSTGLPHSEIFGYNSYLALPRSLSQLVTSFIASESQGIRHTLLVTFLSPYLIMRI